jgi:Flp pilus assembly protein TadB
MSNAIASMNDFLEKVGQSFLFKKWRPSIRTYVMKAGFDEVPYKQFGILFFLGAFINIPIFLLLVYVKIKDMSPVAIGFYSFFFWVLLQLIVTFMMIGIAYFYYNIKIYKRTQELEDKLPDYLTLVSTNLKGGLSFEKSLWAAIKPEFGILAKEIMIVSKKVVTGNDVAEAMIEFSNKYDSPILKRSMNLLVGEIESGGKITEIIDKIIENLRKTRALKAEMAAATVSYMIFIGVIVVVIAPGLFALSSQLLKIIIGFTSTLAGTAPASSPLPITFGEVSIKPENFRIFSILALSTIAIFSSMIISIIEKGSIKGGIKYIPAFLFGSLIIYLVLLAVLDGVFSSIIMTG